MHKEQAPHTHKQMVLRVFEQSHGSEGHILCLGLTVAPPRLWECAGHWPMLRMQSSLLLSQLAPSYLMGCGQPLDILQAIFGH